MNCPDYLPQGPGSEERADQTGEGGDLPPVEEAVDKGKDGEHPEVSDGEQPKQHEGTDQTTQKKTPFPSYFFRKKTHSDSAENTDSTNQPQGAGGEGLGNLQVRCVRNNITNHHVNWEVGE